MTGTPLHIAQEADRLRVLSEFDLDYELLQEAFSGLTAIAAQVTGANVTLVNLIDAYNSWTVAQTGAAMGQMDREEAVCHYTIATGQALEINDLSKDKRFKHRPYVTQAGLRYYYGVPLKAINGQHIGTLCVLDSVNKELTSDQKNLLHLLGKEVMARLENLKQLKLLKKANRQLLHEKKMVAHDIRGPIAGIIGLAQLICEQGEDNEMEEVLEYLKLIKDSGNSVLELAVEILDTDQRQTEQSAEHLTNLSLLKEKIIHLFAPRIKDKGLSFSMQASMETDSVFFPKENLQQILGNLISNAVKFTPADGKITVELELVPEPNTYLLNIIVSDTGTGMDQEKVASILQGAALSTEGTSGEVGYGLGLNLVKQLVQDCHGKLMLSSQKGIGTTFKVSIPFDK
ncbi:GAF domain-containing sensor histidine kinase [Mucilaginibacter sp. PAMB04274]|uniref:GAF domain-containing sensor histidine kinase n=1 Tax=Mucilaginibacter sp. PAMB04274 TaxID=3138568 RepID=UPI0031F5FA0D